MKITDNYTYIGPITELEDDQIAVFGSNTEGRHGAGFAKVCKDKFGAIPGQSHGRQGRCFAIITKDISKHAKKVGTFFILGQVLELLDYAWNHPQYKFLVPYTAEGKNLNGYNSNTLSKIFRVANKIFEIPHNVIFEDSFDKLVRK